MMRILIIGAGVIGASIAYELSRVKNLQVTLIDSHGATEGATCAALGVLMGVISHKTKGRAWKLRQSSLERYRTLIPELRSLTNLPIAHNQQGILMLRTDTEDRWEKLVTIRQSQGFSLELWDREKLYRFCPEVDNPRLTGAVYSPQDTQIHPGQLTAALVAGAVKNGIDCRFGVTVENIIASGDNRRAEAILTSDGIYQFDRLVISAGLGSTALSDNSIELRPVLGQALEMKLPSPLETGSFAPVITGEDVHIVPLGDCRYWVGATVEFPDFDAGEVHPETGLLEGVRQKAIDWCPGLALGTIERTWWGKRPRPHDRPAPVIETHPDYDNILFATGHYRNGVLLAPATASIIKDMIIC
ncbi:MAG: FAD-dependent oxidoreductase [Chlorogloea purpurea SAG 13.99]|nr:FAD-dependent oxidoreductase [Chlorogloea purpurea SAG 13.99]